MKNITFKNGIHEINYQIQSLSAHLTENKELQAAINFISLIEMKSAGATEYIFEFVNRSLPSGFFDNPDSDRVAGAFALRIWYATYLALEGEWEQRFFEAVSLNLLTILGRDNVDFFNYLLCEFANMLNKEK